MKRILILLFVVASMVLFSFPYANRDIATDDILIVTEADETTYHYMKWSDVETFVEKNLDTFSSAIVNTMPTVTGTADSVYLDYTPNVSTLTAGLEVTWIAYDTNTGATTLTIDGLTEKNIYECSDISALEAGDIDSLMVVRCVYDGTQWQQISQSGN